MAPLVFLDMLLFQDLLFSQDLVGALPPAWARRLP